MSNEKNQTDNTDVKIKTNDKILNAARKLFVEKGFDGASVEEIAKEANVTKSLLYYYYESKDMILYELMKGSLENTIKYLAEKTKSNEVPVTTEELFDRGREAIEKEEDVLRIALSEALKKDSKTNLICELPITIFDEFENIFNFTNREKLLFILFAVKIITFNSLKDKISNTLGMEMTDVDRLFKNNIEPIFDEITRRE